MDGVVSEDDIPGIRIVIAGREWTAMIDTGFNGDLELPDKLRDHVAAVYDGPAESELAAGQVIVEDSYRVEFPFDGKLVMAFATFVDQDEILIGTHLLEDYRLEIDFPHSTVHLERTRHD